ncbi:hypothetical protein D2L64_06365 [Micromonospora radicis]|uniref:Uncharacterized protein n=1 Tax=Micromonospora radicis TaxID=1894971 RepID=A0A418MZC3_9ACTN|nr:hypothetical protein D2L64_06365 [Micromonospora radicis]
MTGVPVRLWPLAGLAVLVTVAAGVGLLPRWPGLVHLVALPPLDLYGDLRLLLTWAPSWPLFVLGLAASLTVRVSVLVLMLGGFSWSRVRLVLSFYLLVLPLLLFAAEATYAAAALLYSRLFWPALAVVAALAMLLAPVPWRRTERFRSALAGTVRGGFRAPAMLGYALVVAAIGALATVESAVAVWLVPVSALATAATVVVLRGPTPSRPQWRLAGVLAVLLFAATVFVATRPVEPGEPAQRRAGSILLMSGINSASGRGTMFSSRADVLGYDCDQTYYFSYAGPGDGQPRGRALCPIRTGAPYQPADTQQPLPEQVAAFAAQVRELPRPLVVMGHSHGAWVAWDAVARGLAPQVDVLVLVGPFPESPVGYPPPGRDGRGRVAGDLLRLLVPIADAVDFQFEPDAPAARELLAEANSVARLFDRPLPAGTRAVSVTSATDLPLMPDGWRLPVSRNVCPLRVAHPYLPDRPAFYREVNRFLDGRPALDCPPWRTWGRSFALPFGVPAAGRFD